MDIENIIHTSLKNLTEDYELRREIVLDILHTNIDKLINCSEKWFSDNLPEEYRDVIRSLMSLTTSFLESGIDYERVVTDEQKQEFNLEAVLHEIIDDFNSFAGTGKIQLMCGDGSFSVLTSESALRRSVYNILLSLYVFMDESSKGILELKKMASNVIIEIMFSDLNDFFPGRNKILRPFFPYLHGKTYKIGIGILTAINTLRNIGSQVKIDTLGSEKSIGLHIAFPSMDFIAMVDNLRKTQKADAVPQNQGTILILINDIVIEMILREVLQERGYKVTKFQSSCMEDYFKDMEYKAIIADYSFISKFFISYEIFKSYIHEFRKTILLYGSEDKDAEKVSFSNEVVPIKKPFQVDEIIKIIENF